VIKTFLKEEKGKKEKNIGKKGEKKSRVGFSI
jgi:hypothetical protein